MQPLRKSRCKAATMSRRTVLGGICMSQPGPHDYGYGGNSRSWSRSRPVRFSNATELKGKWELKTGVMKRGHTDATQVNKRDVVSADHKQEDSDRRCLHV